MSLLDMHNTNKKTQKRKKQLQNTNHKIHKKQNTHENPCKLNTGYARVFMLNFRRRGPKGLDGAHQHTQPLNPYGLPHYALNLPNALGTMSMPFLPK